MTVNLPNFIHNGKPYSVVNNYFDDFTSWDKFLVKEAKRGKNICFIYSINSSPIEELIYARNSGVYCGRYLISYYIGNEFNWGDTDEIEWEWYHEPELITCDNEDNEIEEEIVSK